MKDFLIKTVCKFLGKSLVYLKARDDVFYEEFKTLPKNLSVGIKVLNEPFYLVLKKEDSNLSVLKALNESVDLEIVFKSRKSAKLPLLGKIGVRESFSRHDIMLKGNINTAVILVRLIERVESYLFPRFITKKYLKPIEKQISSFKLYWFLLFGKTSKIYNQIPSVNGENANNNRKLINKNAKYDKKSQKDYENALKAEENSEKSDVTSVENGQNGDEIVAEAGNNRETLDSASNIESEINQLNNISGGESDE